MADKKYNDLNITNNNPSYTNNNNINNINYNNRSGSGWTWFKTIFIVCMLTIFSVVCFGGGINSLPKNYTNTIKNETIKTLIGYEEIPPEKDIIYENLTLDNITDYTFSFKKSFQLPIEFYNNFNPSNDNDIIGLGNVIDKENINIFNINSDVVYNNNAYPDIQLYGMYDYPYSSSYVPINYSIYNMAGHIGFNTWVKNGRYGFMGKSFNYLFQTKSNSYPFDIVLFTTFTYFDIKFTDNYVSYYKIAYGNDLTKFNKMLDFLYYSTDFVNLLTTTKPIYVEYPVKYVTYNWDYKLKQLSYFKNIFTPIFNNNQEKNDLLLQQSFNKLQRWLENGVVEYIGDKQTNNVTYSDNWDYHILLNNKFVALSDYIEFFTSNNGKYINDNYYYNYDTKSFVQYSDTLYGSYNDELSIKEQIINILAYPLSTGFNILFNIGVIFTFILIW